MGINTPWYLLVLIFSRVPEAYPPRPLVTNHSRARNHAGSLEAVKGNVKVGEAVIVYERRSAKTAEKTYFLLSETQHEPNCDALGLWNKTLTAWHNGLEVIANRAKQSLPENRDCFVAGDSSQ